MQIILPKTNATEKSVQENVLPTNAVTDPSRSTINPKEKTASHPQNPQQNNNNDPLTGSELGMLWDRYGAGLVLYARNWCANPEDVVQEVLWKLARQIPRPADPVAWIFSVTRNSAISAVRSENRRRKNETAAAQQRQNWFEENLLSKLEGVEVTAALQCLNESDRELIMLHLWSGLTFEQIAAIIGQSSSTAQRHYANGLRELKKRLEK